MFVSTVKMET